MIETVHLITTRGVVTLEGSEATEKADEIRKKDNELEYIFYDNGTPIYIGVMKPEGLEAIRFPSPGEYGTTAPQLYSMVETYPYLAQVLIEEGIKEKPTLYEQLKRATALILPIVVGMFIIFLLAVMLGG